MMVLIVWIVVIALVVAFAIFLAIDDRKNQRIRAEEDRVKALEEQAESEKKRD